MGPGAAGTGGLGLPAPRRSAAASLAGAAGAFSSLGLTRLVRWASGSWNPTLGPLASFIVTNTILVEGLFLAFFINAAILILSAATFHGTEHESVADINDAYHLLSPVLGAPLASAMFAIALLAVQSPLLTALALLAAVAASLGIQTGPGATQWALVLVAGAAGSMPVARRWMLMAIAVAVTVLVLTTSHWFAPGVGALVLLSAYGAAGPLRDGVDVTLRAADDEHDVVFLQVGEQAAHHLDGRRVDVVDSLRRDQDVVQVRVATLFALVPVADFLRRHPELFRKPFVTVIAADQPIVVLLAAFGLVVLAVLVVAVVPDLAVVGPAAAAGRA